jgi:hypothetical protein
MACDLTDLERIAPGELSEAMADVDHPRWLVAAAAVRHGR